MFPNLSVRAFVFRRKIRVVASLAAVIALFSFSSVVLAADTDLIARGKYLAIAADCAACHTNGKAGAPFAGGYPIYSPMGVIFSTNITPSRQFGIGNYSEEQFARAVREGTRADGAHLYPAMPYPSFSRLADEDVKALYAFFMEGVEPVDAAAPETKLPFPFSIRASMIGWNLLFRNNERFAPDTTKTPAWNRGKYLVDGLAHCGDCHTPRNQLLALNTGQYLAGGEVGAWYAPNLTSDPVSGIGGWSDEALQSYLLTGKSEHARASGPMAEAVQHSLQHLTTDDTKAMIAYLRTVEPIRAAGQTEPNFSHGEVQTSYDIGATAARRGKTLMTDTTNGADLYEQVCASCHQSSGTGTRDGFYPALTKNTTTGQPNATDLIATILYGVQREVGGHETLMPGFGATSLVQPLDNTQVASLSNYVLAGFGNAAIKVTPEDVATVRAGGPAAPLVQLADPKILAAIGAAVLLMLPIVATILVAVFRRKPRAV
ncbi:c-type cytochrome [Rhizobium gallicum]|uniref:c-type cytochrome n=1 Tax=Rhizobium gallicum TaxID=56730 RepID=UPI001EF84551|nr:c-type cytochrome [Rhizobium gallicum]ULJ75816.1 c-type cytochrome [Rhizobium gallicum]